MSNDQWGPYETPEGQPGRAASDSSQTLSLIHISEPTRPY